MSVVNGVDWRRFLRIGVVIAFVTTVFIFTAATVLPGSLFAVAAGAIGAVALVTTITGFLIAAASTLESEGFATGVEETPVVEPSPEEPAPMK